ncbi:MAG: serine/threonine-protein kinase [Victivallaceae bacterium]|nr:serine/threonine-protein kinase [Victivallaceae bacterium]
MIKNRPVKVFCGGCHAKLDVSDLEPFSKFACPECGMMLRVPMKFDRYLLEKVCGEGGMSVVYRAIEPELARRVAVKVLKEEFDDDAAGHRFMTEARLVGKLNHPGIIPIYNCGVCDRHPFIVMEFMERGSLEARLLAEKRLEPAACCRYLANVAGGLMCAHSFKIVHHDVKPGNIFIDAADVAKLGDFDLADLREDGDDHTLCAGWGSPGYVSPERLLYGGEDFHGDIFSLGVTIYELLSGQLPFGLEGEPEELLERREMKIYPHLVSLRPELRPELSKLVDAMLEYMPGSRPDYLEIINELNASAEQEYQDGAENASRLTGWLLGGRSRRKK